MWINKESFNWVGSCPSTPAPRLVHAHKYQRKGNRLYEDLLRNISITTTGRPHIPGRRHVSEGLVFVSFKKRKDTDCLLRWSRRVFLFFKGAFGSFICQQMFFISTSSESYCPKLNEAYWCFIWIEATKGQDKNVWGVKVQSAHFKLCHGCLTLWVG